MSETIVGKPIDRADGRLKLTGQARYAAENSPPNLAHAMVVSSTISKGRIKDIDSAAAEASPGVVAVLTHKNAPRLKESKPDHKGGSMPGENWLPLQDDKIHYDGQYVALVVADTLEHAIAASERMKMNYEEAAGVFDIESVRSEPQKPKSFFGKPLQKKRGDAEAALKNVAVSIDATYVTPVQNHCAMEPSATVAQWEGENLTLYDSTQGVMSTRKVIAEVLGIPLENVRVLCPYTGGGFGSKGFCWPHTMLAAMGAKVAKRPVKLNLRRQQTFLSIGHREKTVQRLVLGADKSGKLQALKHENLTSTSTQTEFIEPTGIPTSVLYARN